MNKGQLATLLNFQPLKLCSALLYKIAAKIVISLARKNEALIWTRNSYNKGNLVYGLSDIDFTLVLLDINNSCDEGYYLKRFLPLKKFFLFLGEINIYKQSQLPIVGQILNPHELERDPILKEWIGEIASNSQHQQANKFTYLFRMFLSDYENIIHRPEMRLKKWKVHFQAVNLSLDCPPSELGNQVKAALCQLAGEKLHAPLTDYLSLPKVINNSLINSPFLIFAPQLWHSCFRGENQFESCVYLVSEASYFEQSFFFSQLSWELFGFFTQLPTIEDKFFQYHYHIPFLKTLLKEVACSDQDEMLRQTLISGFTEIQRLLAKDFAAYSKPGEHVNFELKTSSL